MAPPTFCLLLVPSVSSDRDQKTCHEAGPFFSLHLDIPPVKWEGNLQQSPCTGSSVGTLRATWGAAFSPEHCALVLQPLGHRAGALWCPHAMGTAPPGIIWPSLV